ncbi:MAG: AraC family transcriptional regulator ligand-binding domain-containing protein [Myxococcota bacterium]
MGQEAPLAANHGYALDPGFKSLIASAGLRHQDVLRRAGLPEDLLNRPNVRVTAKQFLSFSNALQASVDEPDFPVRLVEAMNAESFSPPAFAALCSPNLTVAATRLSRFKPLMAPVELEVERHAAGLRIAFHWMASTIAPPWLLVGTEALGIVKLARMGTRHHVRASKVTMPELPVAKDAYEAYLGCPIQIDVEPSVSFDAEDATRPFLSDNSAMWEIFEPQLRKRLADLEGTASFQARTRAVLIEGLPSGRVSVDDVARRLALSSRTFQRRLQNEGTSFKLVVRELREELARHYLGTTQLSSSEIAYLLGFEETASFFRAFHRWTGMTPEALRQSQQKSQR